MSWPRSGGPQRPERVETAVQVRAWRREAVDRARASSALERQRSSEPARSDQEAYLRGEINVDELLERVRRYEQAGQQLTAPSTWG